MDIATLRTELNDLIENLEKHSAQFPKNRPVPSLEVGVMIAKVHKIQDRLSVLKYLLEKEEVEAKTESYGTFTPPSAMPQQKTTTPESIIAEEKETEPEAETLPNNESTTPEQQPAPAPTEQEKVAAATEAQELAEKLSRTPINSLKEAFSLNDRYLYANELFDKNMEAFNNLITTIDACNNLTEAQEQLSLARQAYHWDDENVFVNEFTVLVERRFS